MHILEHPEGYATLFLCWARSLWRKCQRNIFGLGKSWDAISVSGDVGTGGHTQGVGEYCRIEVQWILSNWNSENPPIIGVAGCSMDFCHLLLVPGVGNLERPVLWEEMV